MLPFCIVVLLSVMAFAPYQSFAHAVEIWPTPKQKVTKILVYKSIRSMELWVGETKLRSYSVSLGRNPVGQKEYEGDGKTPEGSYFLDFRKADSVAYKAIHVSYPSAQDSAKARANGLKPGGSIMIHGIWNGYGWAGGIMKYFDWTNGCIGLNNKEMDEIWDLLAWNTPIEILP